MRRNLLLIVALIALSSIPVMASGTAQRLPYGSFLRNSASTPAELSLRVSVDRIVASRYERHYHMTADKISEYFRTNLREGTLQRRGTYTMYFVVGNDILAHKVNLPAGEAVFFSADGQPIIDVRCGNPITTDLPSSPLRSTPVSGAKAEREDMLSSTIDPSATDIAEVLTPQYEKVEVAGIQQVSDLTAVPAAALETAGSGLSLLNVASGLASLGAVSVMSSHSSPVPEPSGLILLMGGMGSILSATVGRKLRNRR